MNANDILKYGHLWVHKHLDGLSEAQCLAPNVCGFWSVKDIIAHLTSYEWVLSDVLSSCTKAGPTPNLDQLVSKDGEAYNREQVGLRRDQTVAQVIQEYDDAYQRVVQVLPGVTEKDLRQPGSIPWYGTEYSIDDLIVYQYYGHKREHCAQIAVYRDTLKSI
jgi:hypothetical protein